MTRALPLCLLFAAALQVPAFAQPQQPEPAGPAASEPTVTPPYRLQARGLDWRLRPATLVQLQQALIQLLSDERSRCHFRRLELTVGAV